MADDSLGNYYISISGHMGNVIMSYSFN